MQNVAPLTYVFNNCWLSKRTKTTRIVIRWTELTQRKLAILWMARRDERAAQRNVSAALKTWRRAPFIRHDRQHELYSLFCRMTQACRRQRAAGRAFLTDMRLVYP